MKSGQIAQLKRLVLEDLDRGALRVDVDRLRPHAADRVDQERDRGDVVEVRVGDEDVVDLGAPPASGHPRFRRRSGCRCRPGRRWSAGGGRRFPRTAEHAQAHGGVLSYFRRMPSRRPSPAAADRGVCRPVFRRRRGTARRSGSCALGSQGSSRPHPTAECGRRARWNSTVRARARHFPRSPAHPERLIDRDRPVLALHPDAVDFAKNHVLHQLARRLAGEDAHRVALGAALQARATFTASPIAV